MRELRWTRLRTIVKLDNVLKKVKEGIRVMVKVPVDELEKGMMNVVESERGRC